MGTYTYQRFENILGLFGADGATSWQKLQAIPPEKIATKWKDEINKLAAEYHFTPRFSLMRIIEARSKNVSISELEKVDDNSFSAIIGDRNFSFPHVTIEYAQNMNDTEIQKWLSAFKAIASCQPDYDEAMSEAVISRAWFDEDSANTMAIRLLQQAGNPFSTKEERKIKKQNALIFKNCFSRDDCFLLGHILGFTLPELEFFMLRSLEEEEGIHFRNSNDLIECFGFLAGYSWYQVESLKELYATRFSSLPKAKDAAIPLGITRDIGDNLPALVEEWKRHPEKMNDNFIKYLEVGAPYLDCPSVSGTAVYRNLAVWALDLIDGKQLVPSEKDFLDCIGDVIEIQDDRILPDRTNFFSIADNCREIAERLVKENQIQSATKVTDPYVSWRTLRVDSAGAPTLEGGLLRKSDRIAQLLSGKIQVEKADILFMLWFVANFVWQSNDTPDEDDIFCRVCDFREIANKALEAGAINASFHVPHLMEHSMLLSIACGSEENDPAVVYEQLMVLFAKNRVVTRKADNHPEEEQLKIVLEYRASNKTLKEFAEGKNVSDKTISYWQKNLVEKGLLPKTQRKTAKRNNDC